MTTPAANVSVGQLTAWAENCLSINHLGTLVQRAIANKDYARAADLSERARKRAWAMLNEMFAAGAIKPEGYTEPGTEPRS